MSKKSEPISDTALKQYMKNIKPYKPLSRDEERALLYEYKRNGSIEARNKLITSNLKYACKLAAGFVGRGLEFCDLVSEANKGLIDAIEKFDISQDVKVITYSKWWIIQRMQYALMKRGQMPESELPCETDYDTGEDEDNPAVKIANPKDEAFRIDEEENEDERDLKKFIDTVFNVLDERESDMINMYYGRLGYKEYTLEQIGKKYKLTKERVRQIIEKAFRKLRSEAMVMDSKYLSR